MSAYIDGLQRRKRFVDGDAAQEFIGPHAALQLFNEREIECVVSGDMTTLYRAASAMFYMGD